MGCYKGKKLILHVGPHKTASTLFQKELIKFREALKQSGIIYPKTGIEIFGHHGLAKALRSPNDEKQIFKDLEAETKEYPVIVLSSEIFSVLQLDQMSRLADIFEGAQVEVIYYVRRSHGMLPSLWQELIKAGSVIAFDEYMMRACMNAPPFSEFNQLAQLNTMKSVFGLESLKIISYDNAISSEGRISKFFFESIIQFDISETDLEMKKVNRSLDADIVEMVRSLNLVVSRKIGKNPDFQVRESLLKLLRDWPEHDGVSFLIKEIRKNLHHVRITSEHPLVRVTDLDIWSQYQSRILNPYSDASLYSKEKQFSEVFYCSRGWIDAHQLNASFRKLAVECGY